LVSLNHFTVPVTVDMFSTTFINDFLRVLADCYARTSPSYGPKTVIMAQ
jgi:hypothetical protein